MKQKDKETFLIKYFFPVWIENIYFLDNYAYWNLVWKYFKMSLQYFKEKNIFLTKCLFIFISQCNIVCKNIVCDVGLFANFLLVEYFWLLHLYFANTSACMSKIFFQKMFKVSDHIRQVFILAISFLQCFDSIKRNLAEI